MNKIDFDHIYRSKVCKSMFFEYMGVRSKNRPLCNIAGLVWALAKSEYKTKSRSKSAYRYSAWVVDWVNTLSLHERLHLRVYKQCQSKPRKPSK